MKWWMFFCLLFWLSPLTAKQQDVDKEDNDFAEFEDEGRTSRRRFIDPFTLSSLP
jgi:hypothetical protein